MNKAVKKKEKREKNKTLIRGVNLVKNSENGEKINPIIKIEKRKNLTPRSGQENLKKLQMEKKRGSKFFKMKKNLGKEKPHSWEWTGKPQKKKKLQSKCTKYREALVRKKKQTKTPQQKGEKKGRQTPFVTLQTKSFVKKLKKLRFYILIQSPIHKWIGERRKKKRERFRLG